MIKVIVSNGKYELPPKYFVGRVIVSNGNRIGVVEIAPNTPYDKFKRLIRREVNRV